MTEQELRQEFETLMDAADIKWHETIHAHELEPCLLLILEFFKEHFEDRKVLEQFLIELIYNPRWSVAKEVIEFCMYELRWTNVKSAVEELVAHTQDLRIRDVLWDVPQAFSDDWDGAEYYKYYSKEKD